TQDSFSVFRKTVEDTEDADSVKLMPSSGILNAVVAVIVLMIGNPLNFSKLADSTTFCCEIQLAW
ncbi:MAG: hypothetical protein IKB25_11465, partial [Lentisphaeria bacterium]|nr:hypothetical protein [Lentisphaeria bacterium]